MPYFDANGVEVPDLMTKEEADALIAETTKTQIEEAAVAKANAETAAARVAALEAEVIAAKAAQAAAGGAGADDDKDKNLAALRKKLEDTEAASVAAAAETASRIAALEGDKVAQAISAVAGTDAELAKKIRHNYEVTLSGVKAGTAEEIALKVQNAVKLSSNNTAPNILDVAVNGGFPAGAGGAHRPAGSKVEFNTNETAVGKYLGISDADREKYGNDPRLTNMNTK